MSGERAIRTIAVAGAGIVGLSAANAFARALPGTKVTVVETTPDPAALADRLPTAHPGVARFHALIGLDEPELVRTGIATHHLGTIVENWSTDEGPWIHAFGNYGKPAGAIPFDQIWVQAYRSGKALPYDRYSVGAALARAGKFVHPARDPEFVGSRFQYGLRLDPDPYRDRLRAQAAAAGVAFVSGDIGAVEQRDDGGVAALRLTGGERVEADWFIDCTGPAARLFGTIASEFEDWSAWMPFDRLSFITAPANGEPATADRISGGINGWAIEWPLRNRTLSASVGRDGEVEIARGRRLRPFLRNVLALGDAAVALDPLHGFHLELAQSAISLALELLPGRDFHELETQEYNRRAEQVTRRVRDFVALHYARAPGRSLIAAEPPDSLAGTLDQYEHRGRMPFHEDESVSRDSWTAALLGLGVVPHNVDPAAAAVPLADAVAAMDRLVEEIDQTVAALPAYGDYLARIAP